MTSLPPPDPTTALLLRLLAATQNQDMTLDEILRTVLQLPRLLDLLEQPDSTRIVLIERLIELMTDVRLATTDTRDMIADLATDISQVKATQLRILKILGAPMDLSEAA